MGFEPTRTYVHWNLSPTPEPLGHPGDDRKSFYVKFIFVLRILAKSNVGQDGTLLFSIVNKVTHIHHIEIKFTTTLENLFKIMGMKLSLYIA